MPDSPLSELLSRFSHLPASQVAIGLNKALDTSGTAVVTAPPGAGKSTLLPLTMLMGMKGQGKILMLEPRRLAARQIAERMARMLGEQVGQTVGYRVRFENKTSGATRLEVLTEGILTRMLVDDATLEGVDTVVFDEFHERSIHSDLAMALTRHTRSLLRPELKVVVMSATMDAASICQALGASLIESSGRMFPVTTTHADHNVPPHEAAREVAASVRQAHLALEGDILAFLPGQGEIEECARLLGDSLLPTRVLPLYGNLTPEAQQQAIAPSGKGQRKVVLSTPIAETSLTIEGVRIVVDSGWCRTLAFDARTGLSHLETVRISLDMATQRQGRAGRVAEGHCFKLWTAASEHLMRQQHVPELEEADLAPLLLSTAAFGEPDVMSLPWISAPPAGHVEQARQLLVSLGALQADGSITLMGRGMAALPCHPRIARMMMRARTSTLKALACDMAAVLEEKDLMADQPDTDLSLRLSALRRARRDRRLGRWGRIAQVAREYRRMMRAEEDNRDVVPHEVGRLLAYAYPERVAMSTDHIGTFRLAGGGQVRLEAADSMSGQAWLAIASLHAAGNGTGRVFLSAPLDPNDLNGCEAEEDALLTERDNLSWDNRTRSVRMQHERCIGHLVVNCRPMQVPDVQQVSDIVCQAVAKDGLSLFNWDEEVQRLQRRVELVASWHPELSLPDLSTPHLLATAEEWLPFYLQDGTHVKCTAAELQRIPMHEVLWNLLSYELQLTVDRLAPTHLVVPTGSRIRVDYRQGAEAPVLSVRLQECFGMAQTPCVDEGRRPVLMELLSPGFKPVQLTQDLASFWQSTYFEVRKELRRRYPKHHWPENPLEAEAVRGVKRRK